MLRSTCYVMLCYINMLLMLRSTWIATYIANLCMLSRLMVVSREAKRGHMQRTSELFTGSTTIKFVNTLNKPP